MRNLVLLALISTVVTADEKRVIVHGGDDLSFVPKINSNLAEDFVPAFGKVDVIVTGGGLGGLTSAFYLTQQGLKVLLLEKEENLGGLAAGTKLRNGVKFDRGAAYWTNAYEEELNILQDIGLGDFKKYEIREPIDSYLWNGTFYPGIWENNETMDKLPKSFGLFKFELATLAKENAIPNQPIEEASNKLLELDRFSTAEWVKSIPARVLKRTQGTDSEIKQAAVKILQEFKSDKKVSVQDKANGMKDVLDFLDLYTRSALGGLTDQISAVAFANFYSSEIEPRFTSQIGTGLAAQKILKLLNAQKNNWAALPSATVVNISHKNDQNCPVQTTFLWNKKKLQTCSKYAVYASQLKFAPKIIKELSDSDPEKTEAIARLGYSHYSVHIVHTKGHPFRESYDTWVRNKNYKSDHFTDLILGRWMDLGISGYGEFRDGSWINGQKDYFKKSIEINGKVDDHGILSIYHPLPPKYLEQPYNAEMATTLATRASENLLSWFQPLTSIPIVITKVETNSWPFSVHIPAPHFFSKDAKLLRRKTGRIYYAHSNIGTPAFEEALFRGHCAAYNILKMASPHFKKKVWTQCPIE